MVKDEFQDKVIEYGKGNLLVEAGPGSGKTTVILKRIKYLIGEGVEPETFLVITFTRKAAENLQTKLKKYISKEKIDKMQISTIHSFCLNYLKGKNQILNLIDDDSEERKKLFIKKHAEKDLGYCGISNLKDFHIPAVIDKFEEYTNFNVNDEELIKYLEENKPIDPKYVEFMKGKKKLSKLRIYDEGYKDDWYNARYIQTAKAYRKYLDILDNEFSVDNNTLQYKTLKELEKDPITPYTTIFIDEFQDTDPLQYRIFRILLENSQYFTAVGDIDQRIYSFRSSFQDYFNELESEYDCERKSINNNYRSTKSIVDASEKFIESQRPEDSIKTIRSANKRYDNPNFIIETEISPEEIKSKRKREEMESEIESDKILKIVCDLKQRINFNDIAILYRKHSNKTVKKLIKKFQENEIPFSVKGQSDLQERSEIKAMLVLLWYLTRKVDSRYVTDTDEYDWLNFKGFCLNDLEGIFWSLGDETKNYLTGLQEEYQNKIKDVRVEVLKDYDGSKRTSFSTLKKEKEEVLIKIFKEVKKPEIDMSQISDSDRDFFEKLNGLREIVQNPDEDNTMTILELYYELLNLSDLFDDTCGNVDALANLSVLTQTMHNYETMISKTDVIGLYFFLKNTSKDYSSNYSEDEGVQLMTVHSAKGLEFTATIVASLKENEFPPEIMDKERDSDYLFGTETFYTPNNLLEYKNGITIEEENERFDEEELRVIYVAMTRAADLLILSCIGETPEKIRDIKDEFIEYSPEALEDVTFDKFFKAPNEKLKLSFSKYSTYKLCPHLYNLVYNLEYRQSDRDVTNLGSAYHEIMESLNRELKEDKNLTNTELAKLTDNVYGMFFSKEETQEEYDELCRYVQEYNGSYSEKYEVMDTELQFSIDREEFSLNGAIDLIYKISDSEIGILDYKYTSGNDNKVKKYSEQLYTYALALKEHPDYKDYTVKEAEIHFVKSDKEKIEINEELLEKQMERLMQAASDINEGKYGKKISKFCQDCDFRLLCHDSRDIRYQNGQIVIND